MVQSPWGGTLERLYALQDANWNVTAFTDASGDVIQRLIYDPYGESTELDSAFDQYTGTNYTWEFRFTGQKFDYVSGLYLYRFRYYHSALGSFAARDPVGYGSGPNLYEYTRGNPNSAADPFGLFSDKVDIDGWVFTYSHDVEVEEFDCDGGKITIDAKADFDIYFIAAAAKAKLSMILTKNDKKKADCVFTKGKNISKPNWDWDIDANGTKATITIGAIAGYTNVNIDASFTGGLINRFNWRRPWTALDWGVEGEPRYKPYLRLNYWSDDCDCCFTASMKVDVKTSAEARPGRIVAAAVAVRALPAFARGIRRVLERAVDDIIEHLPGLAPGLG